MKHVCDCQNADNLATLGPLVQVGLLPHPQVRADFLAQGTMSEPIVKFMVDTGADRTVVERRVADSMGLAPIRFAPMVGVSQQPELCPVYLMTIRLAVADDRRRAQMDFNAEIVGMKAPPIPRQYVGAAWARLFARLSCGLQRPEGAR